MAAAQQRAAAPISLDPVVIRLHAHVAAPVEPDPIFAAIDRHNDAWVAYQVAPEGEASIAADAETYEALHALLATPCATRVGALSLLRHLRWWLAEEAVNADAHEIVGGPNAWTIAEARAADLTLFLRANRIRHPSAALPLDRLADAAPDLRHLMEEALILAKTRAGGPSKLGRALGISPAAVGQWRVCPAQRVLDVERLSGVLRHELRPDLYPAPRRNVAG